MDHLHWLHHCQLQFLWNCQLERSKSGHGDTKMVKIMIKNDQTWKNPGFICQTKKKRKRSFRFLWLPGKKEHNQSSAAGRKMPPHTWKLSFLGLKVYYLLVTSYCLTVKKCGNLPQIDDYSEEFIPDTGMAVKTASYPVLNPTVQAFEETLAGNAQRIFGEAFKNIRK